MATERDWIRGETHKETLRELLRRATGGTLRDSYEEPHDAAGTGTYEIELRWPCGCIFYGYHMTEAASLCELLRTVEDHLSDEDADKVEDAYGYIMAHGAFLWPHGTLSMAHGMDEEAEQ